MILHEVGILHDAAPWCFYEGMVLNRVTFRPEALLRNYGIRLTLVLAEAPSRSCVSANESHMSQLALALGHWGCQNPSFPSPDRAVQAQVPIHCLGGLGTKDPRTRKGTVPTGAQSSSSAVGCLFLSQISDGNLRPLFPSQAEELTGPHCGYYQPRGRE